MLAWLGVSGEASLIEKIVSRGEPQDGVSACSARRDALVLVASGQFVAVGSQGGDMSKVAVLTAMLGVLTMSEAARSSTQDKTLDEVRALVSNAEAGGLVRTAKKTKPVDARPAKPGEVVVTVIAGEGKETQSAPAKPGDWVVRNRCQATGNEEYLVNGAKFVGRYQRTGTPPGPGGWQEHRPVGKLMRFVMLTPAHGEFAFTAPWGERMVAKPGDAIVQDPGNPGDTYRVAAAAFACTYEVVE